jgi:hypothetical protein
VLDRAAQRRERSFVAQVVPLGPAVEAEQEIGAALVGAERLHEQLAAVRGHGEVGGGTAGVDARRDDAVQRESHGSESIGDGDARWLA